jgi:Protein of unknown function (DUF3027)
MRSRTADRLCAEAVDLARAAAEETAGAGVVGEHLGAVSEGDRVVTHSFVCRDPAYRGWRWAVTIARASRSKAITVDETVLLPDADALLAPEWVPWSERLRPGDMGPGDLLPTEADDLRLEPGWLTAGVDAGAAAAEAEAGEAAEADDAAAEADAAGAGGVAAAGPAEPGAGAGAAAAVGVGEPDGGSGAAATAVVPVHDRPTQLAAELGLRRARVLSRYGLHTAADRWDEAFGPKTPMAQAAPANCASCGFLVPVAGSLRQAFGICANEFSPADGRVVSLAYGCGGHSEAAVMPRPVRPAPPVLDDLADLT